MYIYLNVYKQMTGENFVTVTLQYLKPFNCVQKKKRPRARFKMFTNHIYLIFLYR